MIRKNYVGLISSSQIEEYVEAKGNTLVDHKKGVDQDSDLNDAMRMHETERKQHKGLIHTYETAEIQF